ncbi:Crp/Fnr family transcriptional regulator [Flavobacterium branchiophilum]|uniref:Crp/Fnr family transcriptional regulator n=2 Tax=Flavobacterium branchiophilum TaxID=55197 RepID=A0A2H3KK00_9FLAO|nr:Crp/Fnr family transcriptional regulator [Flavobacterium branchiophilum]PDS25247.1 Crp/Fnr family transcriptional regulator [Flavobacterium branchiophilum]CCB69003.1 Probable transcriptional regulatory protein, Crp/Fnr family [Flavobacterium branchiophilum FL-15]
MKIALKKIFPNFSNDLISEIENHATLNVFEPETILMRTGQYIKNTVLVLKGRIKIYREDDEGGEFFMYYLQPGQACAISMICATRNKQSQIMAKVVEETEIISIPLQLMDKWMMNHKTWYEFVIETYRSRFEEVLEVVDNIAFRAMDERLEFYLKRHSDACGCFDLKISHQQIGNELHTSREVVSRLLKKMEQRGMLKLHRNHIELLDI